MSTRRKASDEVLAARAAGGDGVAFGVLATRYERFIRSLCWSPPLGLDAEDLRQEALLGLLEACRVSEARSFAAIATITVRWRVLSARERSRRQSERALNEAIALDAIGTEMPAVEATDPATAAVVREELRTRIRDLPEAVELACQPDVSHVHPPVVIGQALRVIRDGGSIATAAAHVGLSEKLVARWVKRLPAAREARRSLQRRGARGRAAALHPDGRTA